VGAGSSPGRRGGHHEGGIVRCMALVRQPMIPKVSLAP
jgi:hypothetical protein